MGNKGKLTKALAIIGTLLVWLPILAPILLTIAELIRTGLFRFDYLMPAELFPLALVGGLLLLWATLRRRRFRGLIGWGLGSAAGLLAAVQGWAVATGLATRDSPAPIGLLAIALGMLVCYILAVLLTGIGGVRLLWDLFKVDRPVGKGGQMVNS